jgi:hypothetical protein
MTPTCKCGCGESVKFLDAGRGFREYKRGHVSRVHNNFQTEKSIKNSQATRKRLWSEGKLESWNKGLTKETDERVRLNGIASSEGILNNPEEVRKRSERFRANRLSGVVRTLYGPEHSQWKGGVSPLSSQCGANHRLYHEWKFPILKAAEFKCENCGATSKLEVHHDKIRWSAIVHLIAKQNGWFGNVTSSISGDDPDRQALKERISELIVDYHVQNKISGKVLCKACHKALHHSHNF